MEKGSDMVGFQRTLDHQQDKHCTDLRWKSHMMKHSLFFLHKFYHSEAHQWAVRLRSVMLSDDVNAVHNISHTEVPETSGRVKARSSQVWPSLFSLRGREWLFLSLIGGFNYGDALDKSLMFFEAQRSNKLPFDQRVKWRGNSGLKDRKLRGHTLWAIRWAADYFIKAHPQPNVLGAQVGDGNSDHYCWERGKGMTTSRTASKLDETYK
ncbi:hypothetical protein TIFTF001_005916 [Ficus carica]|uniref:cellulase n=1 Tax=Ficus carica TaxID=3494 RepID=A0AA87ZLS0_FICCA|nr:hypothetical protein TIFTF001_005916 [Ficus carica]